MAKKRIYKKIYLQKLDETVENTGHIFCNNLNFPNRQY